MLLPLPPLTIVQIMSATILCLLFALQISRGRLLNSYPKMLFATAVILMSAGLSYLTYLQWHTFASGPIGKYLLPPFAPPAYFIGYAWSWIWSQYIFALAGTLILLIAVYLAPQSWREVRFERHEPILIALSIFLVGHPYWLFYFATVLILYALYTGVRSIKTSGSVRVSFYYFWLPAALLTMLLTPLLKTLPFLRLITITLT